MKQAAAIALAVGLIWTGIASINPAWAHEGQVTVLRGSGTSVNGAGPQVTTVAGVSVHRGPVVVRPAPVAAKQPANRFQLIGGEEIWLLDNKSKRLIGCELIKTSSVGQSRVRCSRRSLSSIAR